MQHLFFALLLPVAELLFFGIFFYWNNVLIFATKILTARLCNYSIIIYSINLFKLFIIHPFRRLLNLMNSW